MTSALLSATTDFVSPVITCCGLCRRHLQALNTWYLKLKCLAVCCCQTHGQHHTGQRGQFVNWFYNNNNNENNIFQENPMWIVRINFAYKHKPLKSRLWTQQRTHNNPLLFLERIKSCPQTHLVMTYWSYSMVFESFVTALTFDINKKTYKKENHK